MTRIRQGPFPSDDCHRNQTQNRGGGQKPSQHPASFPIKENQHQRQHQVEAEDAKPEAAACRKITVPAQKNVGGAEQNDEDENVLTLQQRKKYRKECQASQQPTRRRYLP